MEEAAKKARVAHDVIWTLHHGLFPAKASDARTTKGEKANFFLNTCCHVYAFYAASVHPLNFSCFFLLL